MNTENEKAVRDPIAEAIDLLEKSAEPFDKACMLLRAALQSQSNTPQDGEMREKFERLISSKGIALDYRGDGIYGNHSVQLAWEALSELTQPKQQEQSGEAVAWVEVKDPHEGPYDFHGKELLPKGKHNLYLAPPTSTAIAAMVIKQAADIVVDRAHTPYAKNWDEVAETIRNLLPANAEEELVKVILKVINEAQEYTEEGVSRVLDGEGK
jgi:hypothetical protein